MDSSLPSPAPSACSLLLLSAARPLSVQPTAWGHVCRSLSGRPPGGAQLSHGGLLRGRCHQVVPPCPLGGGGGKPLAAAWARHPAWRWPLPSLLYGAVHDSAACGRPVVSPAFSVYWHFFPLVHGVGYVKQLSEADGYLCVWVCVLVSFTLLGWRGILF